MVGAKLKNVRLSLKELGGMVSQDTWAIISACCREIEDVAARVEHMEKVYLAAPLDLLTAEFPSPQGTLVPCVADNFAGKQNWSGEQMRPRPKGEPQDAARQQAEVSSAQQLTKRSENNA